MAVAAVSLLLATSVAGLLQRQAHGKPETSRPAIETSRELGPRGRGPSGTAVRARPADQIHRADPAPGSCHYRYTTDKQPLPDPKCTPGVLNPKVAQASLKTTVCKSGYTTTIRPPVSITGPEKTANAKSYSYTEPIGEAEYDGLLSGDVTDHWLVVSGELSGVLLTMSV
ncbi:hypothetical protein [Streptomyces sp. NPDC056682]|uniref:hypothetical protein n=1 Tax=Streptomyces sp. NPDC056682 TaxID=3345909 RepID=UPI0036BBFC84